MSTRRQRSTVPADSGIKGDRKPLQPAVEPIIGGTGRTESRSAGVTDSQTPAPKWATLERKEARLRTDQIEALAALRRRVSAQRADRSEIITDNTLIRIAVDALLAHGDHLHGDTEEQLLQSLARPARRTRRAAG